MPIVWITDDASHLLIAPVEYSQSVVLFSPGDFQYGSNEEPEIIVVYANAGPLRRSRRIGLKCLQKFRRESASLAPALVYSFETRLSLSQEFPIIAFGQPGIGFIQLPCTKKEFAAALSSLVPITTEQHHQLVRWSCGLQDEWKMQCHEMIRALDGWPNHKELAGGILNVLGESVRKFAPDQSPAIEALEAAFLDGPDAIRSACQRLEGGLCYEIELQPRMTIEEVSPAPERTPPAGFVDIMIADDNGYELQTIKALRKMGYNVEEPALNLDEASYQLNLFRPSVVLADLHFPSVEAGKELLRRALGAESVRLVIAVSRARVRKGELPLGVEDCCGGSDYCDPERIHRLIWRRAASSTVKK